MARKTSRTAPQNATIAYVRVSTDEQANQGVSLEAQEAKIRAYCTMRGLELVDMVIEAGVSAGKPLETRDGGQQVIDAVSRGTVRHVVAIKLDRLFRDAADCLSVVAGWDKSGIALHLVDLGGQAVDTSTAMGKFFLTVMAGCAEMERNLIRERTTAALEHKKSKGERVGQIPFGFSLALDGVNLEANPTEQRALELIRGMHARGMSIRKIADDLNGQGVPARGQKWHPTTIARLVKDVA